MATTPPPPTTLRTPPTPRHGAGYEGIDPYVTRQSSRIANRRAAGRSHTTPPPASPTQMRARGDTSAEESSLAKSNAMGALSPPSSTQNSPRRKPGGRVKVAPNSSLSVNNEPYTSSHTSHNTTHNQNNITQRDSTTMEDETLPTPAKTPRKKMVPDSNLASRVLFPSKPPATPEKQNKGVKKGKKHSAFSLESFNETGGIEPQDSVQIFTDSRDRIPQLDESEDNPFYQKSDVSKKDSEVKSDITARTTKRRKVDGNGELKRDKEVEKAINRDDGMFYVFRGKKIFKKFDEEPLDESDYEEQGLLAGRTDPEDPFSTDSIRPLTRSSVKPRLLFPTAEQRQAREAREAQEAVEEKPAVADEEATTDIEENIEPEETIGVSSNEGVTESEPTTPTNQATTSTITTPTTPKHTGHSLRSHSKRSQERTPVKTDKTNTSFDVWKRTKSSSDDSGNSTPQARKRGLPSRDLSAGPAKKKARGN